MPNWFEKGTRVGPFAEVGSFVLASLGMAFTGGVAAIFEFQKNPELDPALQGSSSAESQEGTSLILSENWGCRCVVKHGTVAGQCEAEPRR